jgi:hypothetical protein
LPVTDDDQAILREDLRRSFGALERSGILPVLQRLEAGVVTDPDAFALGVIPPEVRVDTFYQGIERVVLPRLAQLGFDGPRSRRSR